MFQLHHHKNAVGYEPDPAVAVFGWSFRLGRPGGAPLCLPGGGGGSGAVGPGPAPPGGGKPAGRGARPAWNETNRPQSGFAAQEPPLR